MFGVCENGGYGLNDLISDVHSGLDEYCHSEAVRQEFAEQSHQRALWEHANRTRTSVSRDINMGFMDAFNEAVSRVHIEPLDTSFEAWRKGLL